MINQIIWEPLPLSCFSLLSPQSYCLSVDTTPGITEGEFPEKDFAYSDLSFDLGVLHACVLQLKPSHLAGKRKAA